MKRAWIILGLVLWPTLALGQTPPIQIGWYRGSDANSIALPGGAIITSGQKLCIDGVLAGSLLTCGDTYAKETTANTWDWFAGDATYALMRLTSTGLMLNFKASTAIVNPTSELTIRSGSTSGGIFTIHPFASATDRLVVMSEASDAGRIEVYDASDAVTITLDGLTGAITGTVAVTAPSSSPAEPGATNSGTLYTNTTTATLSITLPDNPTVGMRVEAAVTATGTITITNSSGESLYLNGATSCSTSISSTTVGATVIVTAVKGGTGGIWMAQAFGPWNCNY